MALKNCEKVLDGVSAILDGEVGPVATAGFHAHLLMCRSCKRYFEQFKAVKEAAGVVTKEDLPEDFDQVMAFVLDQLAKDGR
jgi:predicted anti-sigma-YlaC factor YlaD